MSARSAPRSAFRWVVAGLVMLLLLCPLGIAAGVVVPRSARHERLSGELRAALDDFAQQRWERPVLRGVAVPGNAHDAQMEAVLRVRSPAVTAPILSARLGAGEPVGDALERAIEANASALDEYRRATWRSYSWGAFDPNVEIPNYLPHLQATRLLIAQATLREPAECLAILADTVRLGQDRAAGASLVALMVLHAHARTAFAPMQRCLIAADHDARSRAAEELTLLARHPAPTGFTMEAETLFVSTMFAQMADDVPSFPTDGLGVERWLDAGEVLEAWDLRMGTPSEARRIGRRYPRDIADMLAWERDLSTRGNETLATASTDLGPYLERDAETRAIVRMLWAAARMLVELDAAPAARPRLLRDAELWDPLSGAPLEFRRDGDDVVLRSDGAPRGGHGELELRLPAAAFRGPPPTPE